MNLLSNKHILLLCCALPLWASAQRTDTSGARASVAFGSQLQDQVTSSISSVSSTDLRKSHVSILSNTLFGRLPGVALTYRAGSPGFDDANIFIRGRHTFVDNGFLVLLDGFQINKLNQIAVDEIESITVLKDAAALALYGVKGANGALLITTKRGQASNKLNITFNARYGYQTPTQLPKFARSYDYARLYNEALASDGLPPLYTEKQLNGYRTHANPYLYPDVNWYDEILRKGSPLQDYSLSFNGGNDKAKYFLMLGYMRNTGLYAHTDQEHNANSNYQQINFRANVDISITKRLTLQAGLGGDIEDRKFPPVATEQLFQNMATYAPNLYSVRTPDGKITGTANFPNNPVGDLLEEGYQSRHDRTVQATVRLNEQLDFLTPGLSAFGAVFFNSEFNSRYDKTRTNAYYEPIRTTSATGEDSLYYLMRGASTDLTVTTGNNVENDRITFQGGFEYQRAFRNHEVGGMIFYQQDKYSVLGDQAAYAMQNIAGRLTYNYRQKYFAELGFSYSGTENYAPGKRFGFFPAVSAGWLIHKENFWQPNDIVNYLKLRVSAGLSGNDRGSSRFAYNQYWGIASSQGYYFGPGQTWYNGLVQLSIANPNITWETARIYNLGIESRMLRSRLALTADLFYEDRYNILVNMGNVIPSMSGVSSSALVNAGKVLNHGLELSATYRDKAGSVDYFAGAQFSFARNRIKENYETPKKEAYSSRREHPVSQYFGLEAVGFFKDEGDIIASPQQTFSVVRPGDLKYRDQNGDGIIDVNDEVPIGRQSYPEISYSFNAGASFKGFDLELLFQGTANRSVYLSGYMFWPFVDNANIAPWAASGHWTPENHAGATFPRLTTQPNANNYRSSNFWVRNVNMLRLKNIELGYNLPERTLRRIRVNNLRVFVSGLNLLSWDDLDVDVDAETLSQGYPVMKVFTAGVSMKF